ncbi:D-ribose ABC transporter substrate-binding protein [Glycomyces xiaoerkulensis]|uniref:D-ribose ABC transporter substrate-binding protein n=1 Tax=Glycomyces xiaoerkulensis TaxID=2038139 RepID=UPI000C264930|nr:D-ribose ABC transporter substrate-binding protein [Glycomyces xiaoerkulensis]
MNRKLITGIVAGSVLAVTAACGGGGDTGSDDAPNPDPEAVEGGYVPVISVELANPYWDTEAETARTALEGLGYETDVFQHENDPQRQNELIDTAVSQDAVAIVLDPAGADESIGAVQRATDADIPVFLINAEINEEGIALSQIVANNAQGAAAGAQYFAERMGGEGTYVELYGNPTDNNAPVRSTAYEETLAQYTDMELLQRETANWSREEGYQAMQNLLTAHPDIDGVLSGNDEMALGAIAAIESAGLTPGEDILVMGFDGSPDAVAAIEEGKLLGTVLQPIVSATEMLVEQLHTYLTEGETGTDQEKQAVDCVLITPDNIDRYTTFALE